MTFKTSTWNERQNESFYNSSVLCVPERFKKVAISTYEKLLRKSQTAANKSLTRLNSIYSSTSRTPEQIKDYLYNHFYAIRNKPDFSLSKLNELIDSSEFDGVPLADHFDDDKLLSIAKDKMQTARTTLLTLKHYLNPNEAFSIARRYIESVGIEVPEALKRNKSGLVLRVLDAGWWVRQLRKTAARKVEMIALEFGMVQKNKSIYCSDFAVMRYRAMKKRNNEMMESTILSNELGDELTLKQVHDSSVSNPPIRRAELMTRIKGFDDYAKHTRKAAIFVTLTAPSRYHARSHKYSGECPKGTQSYINNVWARIRSQAARENINIFGFRVAEPHHDGTPHAHFLLFVKPKLQGRLIQIFNQYAMEESPEEKGARKHRLTVEFIDRKKGSATSYIAKYISKNIDGYGVDVDLYGCDAASSAERIAAWASLWGIRQFQQIGGIPVTVWRTLRRIETSYDDETAEAARSFADSGDWHLFLTNGFKAGLKLFKQDVDGVNKYGEPLPPMVVGVMAKSSGEIGLKILHDWELRMQPWTRVNNCTDNKENWKEINKRLENDGFGLPEPPKIH